MTNSIEIQNQFDFTNLLPDLGRLSPLLHGDWSIINDPAAFSALIVLFLWLVFGWFFILHVLVGAWKAYSAVKFIRTILKGITEESLLDKRRDILEHAEKNSWLGELWGEFDETLVENQGHLQNTFDAAHFFNTHTLARGITESRLLAAVPGFLTAIGVIGTFAGLLLGLSGLDLGDAEKAQFGITQLVAGATVAFMTSVWGVGMSVLFNFLEKMVEQKVRNNIAKLQRGIDSLFPRLSPEQTLIYIHDENRKTAVTMEGLAEQIGHRVQEAMSDATGRMLEGIVSGLKEVMTPAIQQLVDSSTNLADRQAHGGEHALESLIKQFSEGLRQQGEEQAGSLQDARDEFKKLIRDWGQSMNKWGEQREVERGKLQHEMSQLAEKLSGTTEAVATQVQSQVKTLQNQSENLGGKFDQFVTNISSTVDAHVGATAAVISKSERLNGQVEHLGNELIASTDMFRQGAEELRGATGGLHQLSDRLNTAAEHLSVGLRNLTERVEQVTRQNAESGGQLQGLLNEFTAVGNHLREAADTISEASKSANVQTTSLREHQEALQNALRDHVKQLQEQTTSLLRDYGERVRGQTIDRLDEWNKQTTEFSASMVNAVNAIAEVVDEIEVRVGT